MTPSAMTAWLLLAGMGLSSVGDAVGSRRLIVAFLPADVTMREQLTERVDVLRCQLADRDVDVYLLDADEIGSLNAAGDNHEAQVDLLRRLQDPDVNGMQLVLVGKDGGVKARGNAVEALDTFLQLIDGMPMRRAEVARNGRSCVDR